MQPADVVALRNTEKGSLFMVGSGPSLLKDFGLLSQLDKRNTWAINRLPGWDALPFRPTFWSASERGHFSRHVKGFEHLPETVAAGTRCFAIHHVVPRITKMGLAQHVVKSIDVQVEHIGMAGLGETLPELPNAHSGILTTMQLAFWMGFTSIYLLGTEFTDNGYAWAPGPSRGYRSKQGNRAVKVFGMVRPQIEAAGRSVVDCTPEGRLTQEGVLDYLPLKDALK